MRATAIIALALASIVDAAWAGPPDRSGAHATDWPSALLGAAESGRIVRTDPAIDGLIPAGARLEQIAGGHTWVEGPLWDASNRQLLFTDIPRNAVYRWREGKGVDVFLTPSGYSGTAPFPGREPGANGLVLDRQGRLVLCEHGDRRISRLEANGSRTTLVARYQGRRLNSPNDAVFRANGDLYFTDPPFGLPGAFDDPARELEFSGVYRLRSNGTLDLLTRELRAPNGIAFSPDERTLYVTDVDAARPAWLAFDVLEDGTISGRRLIKDAGSLLPARRGGPDGLEVDIHGNLFAAGPEAVYILAPDGRVLGAIETGVPTANVAWGDDGSTLYITAETSVYRIRLTTRGAHIPDRVMESDNSALERTQR
ncbi:MAG: SMP-30/gluconolactonase/LRE family protein [Gammaproteobacteria bacterium]|nr:SMP-30/gluconolactonase/LRE family protein [Gammaproteobacteria bacterium]